MPQNKSFTIVYASQTGQAKTIAESLYDLAASNKFDAKIFCISEHDKTFKLNELNEPLVFVCSTTGDGETPETARKCWFKLKRLDTNTNKDYLKNLNYALLGLGDTNYTNFCNGPKLFHSRFADLGAKCFFGPYWADDGVGLELEVEPFKEDLWDALNKFFENKTGHLKDKESNIDELTLDFQLKIQLDEKHQKFKELKLLEKTELTLPLMVEKNFNVEITPNLEVDNNSLKGDSLMMKKFFSKFFNSSEVFEAALTKNEVISSKDSIKKCFDINFVITNGARIESDEETEPVKFTFEPGHAISIICPNDIDEVKALLKRLNVNSINDRILVKAVNQSKKTGMEFVKITEHFKLSVLWFFTYCVDIRSSGIKKATLRMLAEYCSDESEKNRLLELSSKEASTEFQTLFKENSLSLLDLLNIFGSCQPSIDYLVQLLPALSTRSYTLSSAPNQDEMEILFNLVEFNSDNSRTYHRLGIATGYLSKLNKSESFHFVKRKLQTFSFPKDEDLFERPIVMIGPGTGIAPFLSFLRLWKQNDDKSKLKAWLFYGCREFGKDFLFKNEICDGLSQILTKFSVSFSRQSSEQVQNDDTSKILKDFYFPDSKYVQDSLRVYSKDLVEIIHEKQGFLYVCGDAKNMSKDVFSCLSDCLVSQLGCSSETANKYLIDMMAQKRYKQDIWA